MNKETLKGYNRTTYTHEYIIGASDGSTVKAYFVRLDLDGLAFMFSDKPTNSKGTQVVKYRSTKAKREYLASHACKIINLGTPTDLENARRTRTNKQGKTYRENLGECFEWLLAEMFGVKQNDLSNLSHTEGGDLVIEGIAYQVKYERATIAVE